MDEDADFYRYRKLEGVAMNNLNVINNLMDMVGRTGAAKDGDLPAVPVLNEDFIEVGPCEAIRHLPLDFTGEDGVPCGSSGEIRRNGFILCTWCWNHLPEDQKKEQVEL